MKGLVVILFALTTCSLSILGQSIKSITYRVSSDSANPILKIEEFDANGHLIQKTTCLDEKCDKKDVKVFIYNDEGLKVLDSIYTNKWGYHQLTSKWAYSYDKNYRLRIKRFLKDLDKDSLGQAEVYFYNDLGRLSRVEKYSTLANKQSFQPIIYGYDSIGHLVSKTAMHHHDTTRVFYENLYAYDKSGNLVEDKYFLDNRGVFAYSSSDEYEYDNQNRLIQKRWLCCQNNVDSTNYIYDEKGRLKSEETFPGYADDIWKQWFENTYDEVTGLLIRQNHFLNFEGQIIPKQSQVVEYEHFK